MNSKSAFVLALYVRCLLFIFHSFFYVFDILNRLCVNLTIDMSILCGHHKTHLIHDSAHRHYHHPFHVNFICGKSNSENIYITSIFAFIQTQTELNPLNNRGFHFPPFCFFSGKKIPNLSSTYIH